MKKILLQFLFFFCVSLTFAGNSDLFKIDEEELNVEFAELNELKEYVVSHSYVSLDQLLETGDYNLAGINFNAFSTTSSSDFEFQWEGFLWGFLCCPVGFFVIAVNKNKEHDQKISFWIGVAVSSVISMVYNVAVYSSTGYL